MCRYVIQKDVFEVAIKDVIIQSPKCLKSSTFVNRSNNLFDLLTNVLELLYGLIIWVISALNTANKNKL